MLLGLLDWSQISWHPHYAISPPRERESEREHRVQSSVSKSKEKSSLNSKEREQESEGDRRSTEEHVVVVFLSSFISEFSKDIAEFAEQFQDLQQIRDNQAIRHWEQCRFYFFRCLIRVWQSSLSDSRSIWIAKIFSMRNSLISAKDCCLVQEKQRETLNQDLGAPALCPCAIGVVGLVTDFVAPTLCHIPTERERE